jgi:monofunctional biosynthetic peptidoglycan transglycosylase
VAALSEPIVEADLGKARPEQPDMARVRKVLMPGRRGLWFRRILKGLAILVLLPVVLTLLYIPSFVHPVSTLMLGDLVTFQGYDRRWVPLEDIAPVMQHSVIMSEDGQFCNHRGVDLGELRIALEDALEGEGVRGASTIPMQTVKNLYMFNIDSILRKVVEFPLAIYYDLVTPKRRILETYLNIAEWGPNIYGVEAAAQHHFGVSAKKLSRRQAALLTVALPNPITRNPAKPGPGLSRLARLIERRAQQAGAHIRCLDN